jgi:hypothetical protein
MGYQKLILIDLMYRWKMMKTKHKQLLLTLFLLTVLFSIICNVSAVNGATSITINNTTCDAPYVVNKTTGEIHNDFEEILNSYDVVYLQEGRYNSTTHWASINRNISVIGKGSSKNVIFDSSLSINPGHTVTFINLTITGQIRIISEDDLNFGSHVIIKDCVFTNKAYPEFISYYWPARIINVGDNILNIYNCSFEEIETISDNDGSGFITQGVIYNYGYNAKLIIENSTFKNVNNIVGATIYNNRGNVTINNSIFINNKGIDYGAIYSNNIILLTNNIFINNAPSDYSLNLLNPLSKNNTNNITENKSNETNSSNNVSNNTQPTTQNTNNKNDVIITIYPVKGTYGQIILLTAKLTSNNKILTEKTIYFYVNNKLIGSAKTNNQGIATIKYKIPSVAKYNVKTVFNGDTSYNKIENSNSFTSIKAKVSMTLNKKLSKKKIQVKITALGKPLKNKIIKFYVEGKYVGKVKTNSKGIALFKPKKKFRGKQTVKTVLSGDKLFTSTNKSTKIKF